MKKENVVEALFGAGSHFGYSRTRRHPTVTPFLYGNKSGVDIINVEKTAEQIEAAKAFLATLLDSQEKKVLIVGVKPESREAAQLFANTLRMPFVSERWIGGTLTNFPQTKKRIAKLEEIREKKLNGELDKFTKKEKIVIEREMNRLSKYFSGLVGMTKLPDALIVVDTKKEHTAIKEAKKLRIPVIGIGNTDCPVHMSTFPIVANDGTTSSIRAILDLLQK